MRKIRINTNMKTIKKLSKITLLLLIKAIYTLLKNLLHIIYILIYNFNDLMSFLYMKLPRIARVIIIYTLITLSLVSLLPGNKKESKKEVLMANNDVYAINIEKNEEEIKTDEVAIVEKTSKKEETKENKKTCNMSEVECAIYNKGIEKGMTEKQAYLILAISKHETGNWTSSAFKDKHNFGGIMKNGKLATYKNFDEGLDAFVNLLNNVYFAKGRNTIEKIGAIYCPVGASNDPNGLNKYWVPNVTKYYNAYLSK